MAIKRAFTLILLVIFKVCLAENSLIAVVNNKAISYKSIENKIDDSNSYEEKILILEKHIDRLLQLNKAVEFEVDALPKEVEIILLDIAKNNNITLSQLRSYPEFFLIKNEVYEKISLHNLQRFVTKDLTISSNEIFTQCTRNNPDKNLKQIKIAQIIISELDNQTNNKNEKDIKLFLRKLSNHISKGASFEVFAKLHSQHPSYFNGGVSNWLDVDNKLIKMLDLLKNKEVSKVYLTDFGFAIGIKIDERYVSSKLKKCEEELKSLITEEFYLNWALSLRENAYIKIYDHKL